MSVESFFHNLFSKSGATDDSSGAGNEGTMADEKKIEEPAPEPQAPEGGEATGVLAEFAKSAAALAEAVTDMKAAVGRIDETLSTVVSAQHAGIEKLEEVAGFVKSNAIAEPETEPAAPSGEEEPAPAPAALTREDVTGIVQEVMKSGMDELNERLGLRPVNQRSPVMSDPGAGKPPVEIPRSEVVKRMMKSLADGTGVKVPDVQMFETRGQMSDAVRKIVLGSGT